MANENQFGNMKLKFICYFVFEIWKFIFLVFAVKIHRMDQVSFTGRLIDKI